MLASVKNLKTNEEKKRTKKKGGWGKRERDSVPSLQIEFMDGALRSFILIDFKCHNQVYRRSSEGWRTSPMGTD